MPLTDQDVAKIWEYVWSGDANKRNQYNRIADIDSAVGSIQAGIGSIQSGVNSLQTKVTPDLPTTEISDKMYRLYKDGMHKWTSSKAEKDGYLQLGWKDEGVAWSMPEATIIYRFSNPNGDCILTTSRDEITALETSGWNCDGVAGIATDNGKEVHRYYNPYEQRHLFTSDSNEIPDGWNDEGVAFKVM